MCGRVAQFSSPEKIAAYFGVLRGVLTAVAGTPAPRYNIAPGAKLWCVFAGGAVAREREMGAAKWGFSVPSGPCVFNARAETARERPLFSAAARSRRCLVPADGFFEWRREGRAKIPFYFSRVDGAPLALGAIARQERDSRETSLCILTTSANATMNGIHARMPVILEKENFDRWIFDENLSSSGFASLTLPVAENVLQARLVSPAVNRADVEDSPALIAPAQFPAEPDLFGGVPV